MPPPALPQRALVLELEHQHDAAANFGCVANESTRIRVEECHVYAASLELFDLNIRVRIFG
jgi:hypothetical protein